LAYHVFLVIDLLIEGIFGFHVIFDFSQTREDKLETFFPVFGEGLDGFGVDTEQKILRGEFADRE
jgi:hypothetical protein